MEVVVVGIVAVVPIVVVVVVEVGGGGGGGGFRFPCDVERWQNQTGCEGLRFMGSRKLGGGRWGVARFGWSS